MTSQRKHLDYSPEDWWVLEPQIIGTAIDEIILEVPGGQAGECRYDLKETMIQTYLVSKTFLLTWIYFNPDMVIRLSRLSGRSSAIWLKIQLGYNPGQAVHHEAAFGFSFPDLIPHRNTGFSAIS